MKLSFAILFVFIGLVGISQNSNLRFKQICSFADTLVLEDNSIVPGSFRIVTHSGDSIKIKYYLNEAEARFFINSSPDSCISISYRVFPFNVSKPFQHRSLESFRDSLKVKGSVALHTSTDSLPDYYPSESLYTSGSISRGISIGNNQDLILNSSLNLQIDGQLTDKIFIKANITDSNIPVQAEGTSQNLQDFDQVYISLYDEKRELVLGDFLVNGGKSDFLKYSKKSQGGKLTINSGKKITMHNEASFAVSKGRYCKQDLAAIEGNQGPYKLYGCNNELYIIVLSGTEKVFADGVLLTRGEDNDYTIDYNTGEITFTNNFLITAYTRLQVEFEYSDQNYSRYLITSSNEIVTKKSKTFVNVFIEQDNKNSPLQQELSKEDIENLSNTEESFAYSDSYVVDTAFSPEKLLYRKTDTTVNGTVYRNILVLSSNQSDTLYTAHFTFVGKGKGDYDIAETALNGKVYEWIAPASNGAQSGSYAALSVIVAPKLKQVFSVGSEIQLFKKTLLEFEFAGSRNDINRFSDLGSENEYGYAGNINITQYLTFKDSLHNTGIRTGFQIVNRDFSAVNDFRSVEFLRDWNIKTDSLTNEYNVNAGFFMNKKKSMFTYNFNLISRGLQYEGYRNSLLMKHSGRKNLYAFSASYLTTESALYKTDFIRYTGSYKHLFKYAGVGMKNNLEYNKWINRSDSLDLQSKYFNSSELFAENRDTMKVSFYASAKLRNDKFADTTNNAFMPQSFSKDYTARIGYSINPLNRIAVSATYRQIEYNEQSGKDENTVLGKIEANSSLFKRFIDIRFNYEMGSGLESTKEYVFVKVGSGQGVYKWDETTDYNGNGIPEKGEFEIANYSYEANYLKIQLPTNNYRQVRTNRFSFIANADMRRIISAKKGFTGFLSKFSGNFAYTVQSKNTDSEILSYLLPVLEITDTLLISENSMMRKMVHFNQRGNIFKCNYYSNNNEYKITSADGYEIKRTKQDGIDYKLDFLSSFSYYQKLQKDNERSIPEALFLQSRNYNIESYLLSPQLQYQPNQHLQFTFTYAYKIKNNKLGEKEEAESNDYSLKGIYSHTKRGRLQAEFHYVSIRYDGIEDNSTAYIMLDGLEKGKNYIWSVDYQKMLNKSLQLQFTYNGRKSEDYKTIHAGSVVLKAFF